MKDISKAFRLQQIIKILSDGQPHRVPEIALKLYGYDDFLACRTTSVHLTRLRHMLPNGYSLSRSKGRMAAPLILTRIE